MIPARAIAAAALIALVSCGGSAAPPTSNSSPSQRPSSTARVSIVSPAAGSVLTKGDTTLKVALTGARIVAATTQSLKPDEGHLHVLVDGRLISMTGDTEQPITGLANGAHTIRVEFVAGDHAPFAPRVVADVTFEVRT